MKRSILAVVLLNPLDKRNKFAQFFFQTPQKTKGFSLIIGNGRQTVGAYIRDGRRFNFLSDIPISPASAAYHPFFGAPNLFILSGASLDSALFSVFRLDTEALPFTPYEETTGGSTVAAALLGLIFGCCILGLLIAALSTFCFIEFSFYLTHFLFLLE